MSGIALLRQHIIIVWDVRQYSLSQRSINARNALSPDCVHARSINIFNNRHARIFECLVIQILPCGTLDETMHLCDVKCVA